MHPFLLHHQASNVLLAERSILRQHLVGQGCLKVGKCLGGFLLLLAQVKIFFEHIDIILAKVQFGGILHRLLDDRFIHLLEVVKEFLLLLQEAVDELCLVGDCLLRLGNGRHFGREILLQDDRHWQQVADNVGVDARLLFGRKVGGKCPSVVAHHVAIVLHCLYPVVHQTVVDGIGIGKAAVGLCCLQQALAPAADELLGRTAAVDGFHFRFHHAAPFIKALSEKFLLTDETVVLGNGLRNLLLVGGKIIASVGTWSEECRLQ